MQGIVDVCRKQRCIEIILRFTAVLEIFLGILAVFMNYSSPQKEGTKFIIIGIAMFVLLIVLIICNQIMKSVIGNTIKKEVLSVIEDEVERSGNELHIQKKYVKSVLDGYVVYISADIDEYTRHCINNRLKYLFSILQRALKKRISIRWI